MFSKNVVGSANAIVGGWGNLGGGITQVCPNMAHLLIRPLSKTLYQHPFSTLAISMNKPSSIILSYHHHQMFMGGAIYPLFQLCGNNDIAWRSCFVVPAFLTVGNN